MIDRDTASDVLSGVSPTLTARTALRADGVERLWPSAASGDRCQHAVSVAEHPSVRVQLPCPRVEAGRTESLFLIAV